MSENLKFNPEDFSREMGDFADVHNIEFQQELSEKDKKVAERRRKFIEHLLSEGRLDEDEVRLMPADVSSSDISFYCDHKFMFENFYH